MAAVTRTCVLLAVFMAGASADSFLAAQPRVSTAHVRQSLWAELGSRSNPARIAQLEDELRPMYMALPKGEHGNLEHAVVRYAAHRYFVRRHGWHMKGLEPFAVAENMSAQSTIKADMVPSYIQDVFENYLGKRGFALHDLAIYLATLEDLVNQDRLGEFLKTYRVHDFPTEEPIMPHQVDELLSTYMSSYILGNDLDATTLSALRAQNFEAIYPGWGETVTWLQDVRKTVQFNSRHGSNPFVPATLDIFDAELVLDDVSDRYGAFQDLECRALKDALVSMEYQESGRVRLKDFYSKGLGGDWQFTESIAYLRQLGALDEADPRRPSVLIPNYVAGQSNCLVSTGFYTVCCMDECDGLLNHIESKLASPLAEPREIAAVVAALPSATVHAPRNLSQGLLDRLNEIAEHHDGHVPIHGRLFAQFLHHAYPRECTFPHLTGTTAPMGQEDWAKTHGTSKLLVSDEEMRMIKAAAAVADKDDGSVWQATESLPWTAVEELVSQHKHRIMPTEFSSTKNVLRAVVLGVLGLSFVLHLGWRASSGFPSPSGDGGSFKGKEHFV